MTERGWLKGTDGVELAEYWGTRLTERKARLIMLACCRRHERFVKYKPVREALDAVAAHYADPLAPDAPLDGKRFRRLYDRVERSAGARSAGGVRGVAFGVLCAVEPTSVMEEEKETLRYLVFSSLTDIVNGVSLEGVRDEQKEQAVLVREVLGNPFKKVKVKPAWRTDTVLALARRIYAAEDFSAMPILADALQDAGCDSEAILNHCRHESPHVRGCWVLDLLLGKK